ncbi:hypothetical protein JRO89_XS11G0215200 [Xanthoceras sorbifolium]|uniref:WRKY domain-containing protein n=1 Tax=Xanthoceras sorbifolium TaxID=99658 RepID=A0ABQ8HGL5_9ROSI|nr:hypothetical protein JRO89_XS11G0215200 [Xanthoceras sorbifolium]
MENMGDWEQNNLIRELTQGRELVRQLQIHLNLPAATSNSSSSQEITREMLVQEIVSSYEKALSMLVGAVDQPAAPQLQPPTSGGGPGIESPPLSASPRSDQDSDRDQELKDGSKKRKATPRGYYRCTHRHVQGCLATKQVQRSDEDPMIFEITYRGRHTCTQASKTTTTNPHFLTPPPETHHQEPLNMSTLLDYHPQQHNYQQLQQNPQEALLNLRKSLQVVTQDLEIHHHQESPLIPPPFHFGSTSNTSGKNPEHHHQNQVFSPSVMSNIVNNNNTTFTSGSSSFMSPATTSGTNYFSVTSPSGIITRFQGGSSSSNNNQNIQSSDQSSELNDIIISAAASATNSPTVGVDFPFGNGEFDPNFTFDNLGFFSSFHPFEK